MTNKTIFWIRDIGFVRENQQSVPTITIEFDGEDWQSRDEFVTILQQLRSNSRECIKGKSIRPGMEVHECKYMQPVPNDTNMDADCYSCSVCGKTDKLYYDEMK